MLRLTGALLLLAAAAGGAYLRSRALYLPLRLTEGFIALIEYIRLRIGLYREPLDVIFSGFKDETLSEGGVLAALRAEGWTGAVDSAAAQLPESVSKTLRDFGCELGRSPADSQERNCDAALRELTAERERMRRELPQRTRVSSALLLTCGLMLAIIFI